MSEEIGTVLFQETRDGDQYSIAATRIDPVTVIGLSFLDQILTGDPSEYRVVGDELWLELSNGTWVYRLGEYNPIHRGITARLIHGEPLRS